MSKWPMVKLRSLIREEREQVGSYNGDELPVLGVTNVDGITHTGVEASDDRSKYLRLRPGRFAFNPYRINVGSIGISSASQNGICSPAYVVFATEPALEPQYLLYYLKSSRGKQLINFHGNRGSVRSALRFEDLVEIEIPLPDCDEQRRIVARIDDVMRKVHDARILREQATADVDALLASAINIACSGRRIGTSTDGETASELLDRISRETWPGQVKARKRKAISLPTPPELPTNWLIVDAGRLQELGAILDIQDGNHGSDYPRKAEFGDVGVPFVTAKQFENGTLRIEHAPKLPLERASMLRIGFAKANDVLLTHNASVGDVAIAPKDSADFLVGTSVTYWRCNPEALLPRYLYYFMRSDLFQGQLKFIMKQTTRNQVSVLKQVNLWVCLPPLAEQRQIVSNLDFLHEELQELSVLQSETADCIDALMPSVLEMSFRGEI